MTVAVKCTGRTGGSWRLPPGREVRFCLPDQVGQGSGFLAADHDPARADHAREIAPGKLLPSTRMLMQTYEVSDGTVKRAVAALREEGLVQTVRGPGSSSSSAEWPG